MSLRLHLNRVDAWEATAGSEPTLRRAVDETLAAAGVPAHGEISVTCVSEREIRELQLRYLGVDRPTDVLAFDLGEGDRLLGDLYVAPEVAGRNAAEHDVSPEQEVLRLVVHGVLHLLGHDHPEGVERYASEMFCLQEQVVRRVLG